MRETVPNYVEVQVVEIVPSKAYTAFLRRNFEEVAIQAEEGESTAYNCDMVKTRVYDFGSYQEAYNFFVANRNAIMDAMLEIEANEARNKKIEELKSLLEESDYQAIKFTEGWMSQAEYEPIKNQRQNWRDEINQLQNA